jgi:hypothetical protein
MRIRLEFVPADCWVGVYWRRKTEPAGYGTVRTPGTMSRLDVWVCVVPCLPLHLTFFRNYPTPDQVRAGAAAVCWSDAGEGGRP